MLQGDLFRLAGAGVGVDQRQHAQQVGPRLDHAQRQRKHPSRRAGVVLPIGAGSSGPAQASRLPCPSSTATANPVSSCTAAAMPSVPSATIAARVNLAVQITRPGGVISGGGVYLEPGHPVSLFDTYFKNLQIRLSGFSNARMGLWKAGQLIGAGVIDHHGALAPRVAGELPVGRSLVRRA